jgi:hypothetical protein
LAWLAAFSLFAWEYLVFSLELLPWVCLSAKKVEHGF